MLRAMTLLKLDPPPRPTKPMAEADKALRGIYFEPGFDDFGRSSLENDLICDVIRREAKAMLPDDASASDDAGK